MTSSFALPDVFQLANPQSYASRQGPIQGMRYAKYRLKMPGPGGKMVDGPFYWRTELFDSRGGVNSFQRGRLDAGHYRLAESTLEHDHEGHLILPQAWVDAATPDPTISGLGGRYLCYVNAFGSMVMGMGDGNNVSLIREASATDPTPTAITYSPGAGNYVQALSKLILNSQDIVMVGLTGAAPSVMTAISTISGTTMHSKFTGTFGAIQTPISGGQIVAFAAGNFYALASTAALNADPGTATLSVPNLYGVRPIGEGLLALGNGPIRLWWLAGISGTTDTGTSGSFPSKIISTNPYGRDLQDYPLPIKNLEGARIVRNGLAAYNFQSIYFANGRGAPRDLRIFENRKANSDYLYRLVGIWSDGYELEADINLITNGGSAHTLRWRERYDWDLDTWVVKSGRETLSSTGMYNPIPLTGSLPYSEATNYIHNYVDGSWRRQYVPPAGINPYSLRHTSGAAAGTGRATVASGTATWPELELPELEGMPKVLRRITMGGDIDAGSGSDGTKAYATVKPFPGAPDPGMTATFRARTDGITQVRRFSDSNSPFYRLQPEIAEYRQVGGTDPTLYNMNGLPVTFEGLAWPDDMDLQGIGLENTA